MKRSKEKALVQAWVPRRLRNWIVAQAAREGISLADFVRRALLRLADGAEGR